MAAEFTATIDGQAAAIGSTFDVVNPATGRAFATAPACSPAQLDQAMEAAARALPGWRSDEAARRAALAAAAAAITAALPELAAVLCAEQGKPIGSTNHGDAVYEVRATAEWLRYYAELQPPREVIRDDDEGHIEVLRRPLGVIAAFTPWNYPLMLAGWKIGPALLAGNTMVLIPSPYTPLTTLMVGEILRDVFPPGVLNVISGGAELAARMTAHPVPSKISFTGPVGAGRRVAAAAAPKLKRMTLELGGNDAAIVLDDADPDAVADGLFWGAFTNCGQICKAVKRLYVHERIHDDVVAALAERALAVKVGDGSVDGAEIGPVNNRPQFERVAALVDSAIAAGGRVVTGGHPLDGGGYFYPPTIIDGVIEGTPLVDEDQFGPALPVMAFRSEADAVRRANASPFGMAGSVWTADVDRATAVALTLDCGTAMVNTHVGITPDVPFGGWKASGLGIQNGLAGYHGFTEIQVLQRPPA